MGEGGRGREGEGFSPSALTLFRFHLSPFLPETPDTQATHPKDSHKKYRRIPQSTAVQPESRGPV